MKRRYFPTSPTKHAVNAFNEWLQQFQDLEVECDGMVNVLSYMLAYNNVDYSICCGTLSKDKESGDVIHLWIKLNDHYIIDLRSRMWTNNQAKEGVFIRSSSPVIYHQSEEYRAEPNELFFSILTNKKPTDYTPLPDAAFLSSHRHLSWIIKDANANPVRVFTCLAGDSNTIIPMEESCTLTFCSADEANEIAVSQVHNGTSASIAPAFLALTNPLYIERFMTLDRLITAVGREAVLDLMPRHWGDLESTFIGRRVMDKHGAEHLQDIPDLSDEDVNGLEISLTSLIKDEQFIERLKAQGYDGIIGYSDHELCQDTVYHAFSPDQIVFALSTPAERFQQIEYNPQHPSFP